MGDENGSGEVQLLEEGTKIILGQVGCRMPGNQLEGGIDATSTVATTTKPRDNLLVEPRGIKTPHLLVVLLCWWPWCLCQPRLPPVEWQRQAPPLSCWKCLQWCWKHLALLEHRVWVWCWDQGPVGLRRQRLGAGRRWCLYLRKWHQLGHSHMTVRTCVSQKCPPNLCEQC